MTTFDPTVENAFLKHCGGRRACCYATFPSSTMFSTLASQSAPLEHIGIVVCNAFDMDEAIILSSGNGLTIFEECPKYQISPYLIENIFTTRSKRSHHRLILNTL